MKVITISREYGAGGHSIGTEVAKRLGIEFYDRDIISETAKLSGIDIAAITKEEEEISTADNIIATINPVVYNEKSTLYAVQQQVILNLVAEHSPCVILGRCADAFLPEAGVDCLNVFIYADDVHRAIRVGELIGSTDANEISRVMKRTDRARRNYYTKFTGKHWGDVHNFNLALDSGSLGYEKCINIICEAAK